MAEIVRVPSARISAPNNEQFEREEAEYLHDPTLDRAASELIARHPGRFGHLRDARIVLLWKRKGGNRKGAPVLSNVQRLSGLARYYSSYEFAITISADHCYTFMLADRRIEALIFHELCHLGVTEDGEVTLVNHDYEGFLAEIREYGDNLSSLNSLITEVRQLALPDMVTTG